MGRWFDVATRTLPVIFTVLVISLTRAEENARDLVSTSPPKIKVVHIGPDWVNITGNGGAPQNGINSVFSQKGDDLFITCTSDNPIQWNISGIIAPPEIVKIQPAKRYFKEKTFQIAINIFFLDAGNYTNLVASSIIACEEIGSVKNRDELAVFVKGNSQQSLLSPTDTQLEGEVSLIPCPTSDPTTSPVPTLYLRDSKGRSEKKIENVIYYPAEGFRQTTSQIFAGGTYTCRKGSQSVTITVLDSASLSTDNHFAPISSLVHRFSDESVEFQCSSKSKPVKLIFDHFNDTIITAVTDSENSKIVRLARSPASSAKQSILEGKAACIAEGQDLIKEWSWKFVQPPQLHLDNLEGEADCLSPFTPKSVQTVRCKNGMDCDFMGKSCLGNATLCNFKKQKQFFGNVDTYCWIDEKKKGMPCASVPFSHLNGLVKCEVMGLARQWEFFISLDYLRYTHWEDVPLRELVRIEEFSVNPNEIDDSTKLVCTASAYLFADSLAFEIEYKNGSRSIIEQEKYVDPSTYKKSRQILELNVKAVLDQKMIPKDAVAVHCLAPFWNSTGVLRQTKYVGEGKQRRLSAQAASLDQPSLLEESDIQHQTFFIGEKFRRLNCSGAISQTPTWLYKDVEEGATFKPATEVYPELKTGVDEMSGENYLEFIQVEKKYGGDYQCVTSSFGNANTVLAKYTLQVSAEPLPTSTTVYVGVTILVLVIVGLAIAAFAVFVQKRNI